MMAVRSKLSIFSALSAGLLTAAAAQPPAAAHASSQPRPLRLGIDQVASPYVAGTKFRTPEGIEAALAVDLAQRLGGPVALVPVSGEDPAAILAAGKADLVLAPLPASAGSSAAAIVIPTTYRAGAMAVMRRDTDIKTWEQLKGRKVCVAEGGRYVGMAASRHGAAETTYKAPADALLALRIGACDAAIHDGALLEELIKLPEWKKFSARLPVIQEKTLAFVVPATDRRAAGRLLKVAREWQATDLMAQQVRKMARQIAFEVYLDQNVPDCH